MNTYFTLYHNFNSSYNKYLLVVVTLWFLQAADYLAKWIYKPETMYVLRHSSRETLTLLILVTHWS